MRREIDKRLQSAKEKVIVLEEKNYSRDFTSEANALLHFTDSVEDYVNNVLPPKGSSRGTHKSDKTDRSEPELMRSNFKGPPHLTTKTSMVSKPRRTDLGQSTKIPRMQKEFSDTLDLLNALPSISAISESTPHASTASTTSSTTMASPTTSTATSRKGVKPTFNSRNPDVNNAYRSVRAKEYMNDPDGTILSPPKIRDRSPLTSPRLIAKGYGKSKAEWQETGIQRGSNEPVEPLAAPQEFPTSVAANHIEPLEVQVERPQQIEENETESGGDTEPEPEEEHTQEGPTPFQPVAGVLGKFPPGWHQRHERAESPQDFW
ncbi:hypothetical protein N0V90_007861 [Kalmusia sp. IMI 367209]|nr:hypothetical protein N0V90_007861 [Kalmusia sp. IMI 367209]